MESRVREMTNGEAQGQGDERRSEGIPEAARSLSEEGRIALGRLIKAWTFAKVKSTKQS